MPSRTQTRNKQQQQQASAQWLESLEARLNPPLAEDEDVFDPFAGLSDGDAEQAAKLRLVFDWTPAKERLH